MAEVRLLVGIPALNLDVISRDFFDCVLAMEKPPETDVVTMRGHAIDEVRNALAQAALDGEYTHLLMLDADMYYPVDTIRALLWDEVDIVCGFACQRFAPYNFVAFSMNPSGEEWAVVPLQEEYLPDGGTYNVGACGGAALLIRTDVFRTVEKPWFSRQETNSKGETVAEDIYFSLKARRTGLQCHTNFNVRIGHLINAMVLPQWDAETLRWKRLMCQTEQPRHAEEE